MATITVPGMFLTGNHAGRPAAGDVGKGSIYSCTDHGLIYQSDGSSWTTWATLGGGGSSAPVAIQITRASGTNTIAAAASGNRLIAAVCAYGGTVTAMSTTNVTWTKMEDETSAGASVHVSVWLGVVAGGSSGTSVTFTGSGTIINMIVEVADALTTYDAHAWSPITGGGFYFNAVRLGGATAGAMLVAIAMTDNQGVNNMATLASAFTGPSSVTFSYAAMTFCIGYAVDGDQMAVQHTSTGSTGAVLLLSIT